MARGEDKVGVCITCGVIGGSGHWSDREPQRALFQPPPLGMIRSLVQPSSACSLASHFFPHDF